MRILKIEPKDVEVTISLGLNEIKSIADTLNISTVNPTTEEEQKSATYVKEVFFPMLDSLLEDLKNGS